MEKLTKIFPVLGIIILLNGGCAAPKKLLEKSDTTTTTEVDVYNDTVITNLIKTITIWKIDSSGLRIDIASNEQKFSKGRKANRKDSVNNKKEVETDNITPKLKQLENKAVKDSLKGELNIKKQEVKQEKIEHRNEFLRLIIFLVAMIMTGAIVMKVLGLFKK